MAKKIDAGADYGIDAFIFDWYHYDDGPFLKRPIDEGFLKAKNNGRIKFAFMWANHDWIKNLFPYTKGEPRHVLYPGKLLESFGFDSVTSYVWIHHALMPQPDRVRAMEAAREQGMPV